MLLVIGGLSHPHWERTQQTSTRIFGAGHLLIGAPVPNPGGSDLMSEVSYAERLIGILTKYVQNRPSSIEDGVGVLYGSPSPDGFLDFARQFLPFALINRFAIPEQLAQTREKLAQQFNSSIEPAMREAGKALIDAVTAAKNEIASRQNRTPLLLPLENFRSNHLRATVEELFFNLPGAANPTLLIKKACRSLEKHHPSRREFGERRFFEDLRAIAFKSPGRDLHGRLWATHAEPSTHNSTCFLRGVLRLGSQIVDGFHYDCTKGNSLIGSFPDCHGAVSDWVGNPHLNIYPNDAIRK